MLQKRALSTTELERQGGFELPDRDMMALLNIIIFDVIDGGVLNNLTVEISNNTVAAQVCAALNALGNARIDVQCTLTQ